MEATRVRSGVPVEPVEAPFVAVCVQRVDAAQWHAALAWWSEENARFEQIELAFHHDVRSRVCEFKKGVWVRVTPGDAGDALSLKLVIAYGRLVARRHAGPNARVPYGVAYAGGVFDAGSGDYLRAEPAESGLTCATFILAIFESVSWPLVERASWPVDRAEDVAWRDHVITLLEQRGHTDQAERVRNDPACVRFRPTEVAGACLWTPPRVAFLNAREGADLIERA